ncbi:hypothetical protein EAX61_10605 [Dokdonia sinensis]|uniref:Sperm nuclear basic protein PL-I n=1 Tax=Dokdonia sinensis TaxID=2479847 RepID=A0A3M0FYM8_9FLAO|nr:hypothetical protein [Dokdonia sinensis]RMB57565.1 hypothetical protein EAX61_10605 [Dokdonia sinensis]
MKKLALLLIGFMTFGFTNAAEDTTTITRYANYDGSRYTFTEAGIEFSVFPDGEFDFYIPQYTEGVSVSVNAGPVGLTFNTGYDYDPYVQYDDFGAVIQIENTPLYYDNFGRLTQAGSVDIRYNSNRIVRVGGLNVFYNRYGAFDYYTGFINVYNRHYVYRPFYDYFYRPVFNRCLVWTTPYRLHYAPIRYGYAFHRDNYWRGYNDGYRNARRDFRRPDRGRVAHNNGRRGNVDRNNRSFRRAAVTNTTGRSRSNNGVVSRSNTSRSNSRGTASTSRSTRGNSTASRSSRSASPRATSGNRSTSRDTANRGSSRSSQSARTAGASGNSRGTASRTARSTKPRATQSRTSSSSRGTASASGRSSSKASKRSSSSSRAIASNDGRKSRTSSAQRGTTSRSSKSTASRSSRSSSNKSTSQRTSRSSSKRSSASKAPQRTTSRKSSSSKSTRARRG